MKKLWLKIGLSFFILFFVVMVIVGIFSGELMKSTYLNMKENQLEDDAKILLQTTNMENLDLDKDAATIQKSLDPLGEDIDARITVIDSKGDVVADTKKDPEKLDNHMNRPEVTDILKKGESVGISIRESDSLGYSMLYVAVPVKHQSKTDGVLRISISLESVDAAVAKLWGNLALIFGIALVIIAAISVFIARKITRPVREIIEVSTDLANHKYDSRIHGKISGELQDLSISVNTLAESLETQMFEIKQNEQRLNAIVQNLVSGVMLINVDKQVIMTNRTMYQILGETEITGKPFYEVIKSFALSQLIEATFETKTIQQKEIILYFPREMILDASVSPILGENGEITGIILLLHDITQIRHLENVRSEFVTNVSHELKTPVTALKGFAETLLDGAMYDEMLLKKFLTIIKEESDRLHRLIMDILALSRIEQNPVPENVELVEVDEVIEQSARTIFEMATEKNIQVIIPEKTIPSVTIETDRDKLQQILINLLSNAINYTPVDGKVEVKLIEQEAEVIIEVTDNGIGIPAKDIDRVFERFYRVDKARSRHSGGTGLGLSIVKHLVENCGGRIEVESQEEVGSTFRVTLPKKA
ncbi:PAS domain-containing protein [Listeria monocytogenes]|jgi:histidine kinase (EC 2.7.13.3)|uniref:histidine kinase n=3 Tax=Listeria monocytogenes TaxID=1639 RepID=Q8Y4E6_LISMO|nr:ATP-binding protein [Listeria monocytogenes]NP_466023.1 two-component sensor histidine kinase [Listeria monocytogenes EGD-e]EAD5037084.1 PAS domain-containing protein [Listeria monocytogenes serotype 1/2a]EAE3703487.1 PAS domain-containing protein [Listeria monocytogenes serotype 1/2c]EAG6291000.1 PAS domain-containing protein [Listeria monocytogenes CFSAN003825]EAG6318254.1 PAS domain-containing protein [Listeria monocytogenes CFSAN003824]EAG6342153.1 PAS domain-containing protein [Lister